MEALMGKLIAAIITLIGFLGAAYKFLSKKISESEHAMDSRKLDVQLFEVSMRQIHEKLQQHDSNFRQIFEALRYTREDIAEIKANVSWLVKEANGRKQWS